MAKTIVYSGTDAEIKITLSASNSAFAIGDTESVTDGDGGVNMVMIFNKCLSEAEVKTVSTAIKTLQSKIY